MTTDTEEKRLESAENTVELKQLESLIVDKFTEISDAYEKANGELAEMGKVQTETKGEIESLSKSYDALCDRIQEIEQKGIKIAESDDTMDIGKQFAECESVKLMAEGRQQSARMEFKTAIINATGQNQPLVPSDRQGGINYMPERDLRIRDVLPSSATSSNLIEFTREASFTNNAGPTVSGSPEQYENVTKPESAMTFSLVSEPVVTLAHFIPASRQVMDDAASLASHVNGRLMYGLKLKEETQLLSGTGSNHQLNGLITQATAYAPSASPETANEIDRIRDAMRQAEVADWSPDFLVLNPVDWYDIEIRKVGTSDDRYVVGNPREMGPRRIWGMNVVVTNSISSGTFLLGASRFAEIKDRQQAAVELSREDSDNFRKNMVTVLAEERLALCVYRTEAFITGSL